MEGHPAAPTQPGGFKSAHPGIGVPRRTQEVSRAPLQPQGHPWVLHPATSPGATSFPRSQSDRIVVGWVMSLCHPGTSPHPSTQTSAPQHPSRPRNSPQHGSPIRNNQQLPDHTQQIPAKPIRNPELGKGEEGGRGVRPGAGGKWGGGSPEPTGSSPQ